MITYIRDNNMITEKFSGTIFTEDFFQGNVKYSIFSNGKRDKNGITNPSQIKLKASLKA